MQEKVYATCRNCKMRLYSNNEPCKDKDFKPWPGIFSACKMERLHQKGILTNFRITGIVSITAIAYLSGHKNSKCCIKLFALTTQKTRHLAGLAPVL